VTDVHVLGIRHHGPGSARAVAIALRELAPDLVVVEGPPELDAVGALIGSPSMVPPVAGLVYVPDQPRRATFYPLADFSPEWVALRHAADHGVDVRFADLPAVHAMAFGPRPAPDAGDRTDPERPDDDTPPEDLRLDPLGSLAAAAGFDDAEAWWEDVIEHRHHGLEAFAVVNEAMAELRAAEAVRVAADTETLRREAAMRQVLRAAVKEGRRTVAVVCGAWHAPVLDPPTFPKLAADRALLTKLPRVKVAATWVPWTSRRLAVRSGYGAGVTSPGWYRHQFTAPDQTLVRWMVDTSRALRAHGLDASPASTIEAVRLAGSLAAVRGRPGPGLGEVIDATQAVLCFGSEVPLRIVAEELLVGDLLGRVPDDAPMVPLAQDLTRTVKRLRLKTSAAEQTVVLDLRNAGHLDRSVLFHRLRLLGVDWATPTETGRTLGTFKEAWTLLWRPELDVAIIEASVHGTTIDVAASSTVRERAETAELPELTRLVEQTLLADLPDARPGVMDRLGARAAQDADVGHLMGTIEPLARIRRYGDVRGSDTEAVQAVLAGLVARIAIGLPGASVAIADDLAAELVAGVDSVQRGLSLLSDPALAATWFDGVARIATSEGAHGVLAGRANRMLLDAGAVPVDDAVRRLGLALTLVSEPARGAAWIEGFLAGDDTVILHDPLVLGVIDAWLVGLAGDPFDDLLPLLRRSFGSMPATSRRQLGGIVGRLDRGEQAHAVDEELDEARASLVEPLVRQLLGLGS
jgi:hypothetical protein